MVVCKMNIRSIISNLSCFVLVVILSFVFLTNTVSAETKTFIKEYKYQANDEDSKYSSRTIICDKTIALKNNFVQQL